MVLTGSLKGRDISFVGDTSGVFFNRRILFHDSLRSLGGSGIGKLAIVSLIREDRGSTNASVFTRRADTDGVKAETVSGVLGPETGRGFGTGTRITSGVGNVGGGIDPKWVGLLGGDLVTMTRGSGDGNNVAVGTGSLWSKGTEFNAKIVNLKGELVKGVVDVLKT